MNEYGYPLDRHKLPSGWAEAMVGDVMVDVQSGFASGDHNTEGMGVPHLRPMNIDRDGRIDLSTLKYVPSDNPLRLQKGDALFNNTNSPELIGKTAPVDIGQELAFSNHMTRLRPGTGASAKFIAFHLHFLWMAGYFMRRCTHHVNQASISSSTLSESVPVLVAPSNEQHRIVEEIEKQFSRLDEGVANLKRVKANLKRYRASVLQAACEGRLVPTEADLARNDGREYEPAGELLKRILVERRRRWEENELAKMRAKGKEPADDKWKARYQQPAAPDTSGLPGLPEGWVWAIIEQAALIQGGIQKQPKRVPSENAHPFLRVANVMRNRLDLSEMHAIELFNNEIETFRLERGDLLIVEGNGSPSEIGRMAIWDGSIANCVHQNHIIRARLPFGVLPAFVNSYWNSPDGSEKVRNVASTTSGLYTLSVGKIARLPLPLPPLSEQHRSVAEVERRLSVIDQMEAAVEMNLKRADRLRQAILKRAFEGKLVPQDPNDEPAGVLLERIKAERKQHVDNGGRLHRRKAGLTSSRTS